MGWGVGRDTSTSPSSGRTAGGLCDLFHINLRLKMMFKNTVVLVWAIFSQSSVGTVSTATFGKQPLERRSAALIGSPGHLDTTLN